MMGVVTIKTKFVTDKKNTNGSKNTEYQLHL
jgi:hypothetical protein